MFPGPGKSQRKESPSQLGLSEGLESKWGLNIDWAGDEAEVGNEESENEGHGTSKWVVVYRKIKSTHDSYLLCSCSPALLS